MLREATGHSDSFGLAFWSGAAPRMSVAHQHDDLEFNLANVDLLYLADGRELLIPAGRLAMFWAARPHQLISDLGGGNVTWLTVPFPRALGWRLPTLFIQQILAGATVLAPGTGPLELREKVTHWGADEGEAATAATELEVQAFTLRAAAAGRPEVRPLEAAGGGDGLAVRSSRLAPAAAVMAAWLSAHAHEDIRTADVARVAHLSPTHAMTLFRRHLGATIGDYLTQCRVARAQHLLLTTAMPVPDVGLAAGFQSQSQFYARFVERCGMPPAAYRRAAAG